MPIAVSEYEECKAEIQAISHGVRRFGSMWELLVIAYLLGSKLRFSEILLMGKKDGLNSRTLSRTLKSLCRKGLVERKVSGGQPLSISYNLSPHGYKLEKLLYDFYDLNAYFDSLDRPGPVEKMTLASR